MATDFDEINMFGVVDEKLSVRENLNLRQNYGADFPYEDSSNNGISC